MMVQALESIRYDLMCMGVFVSVECYFFLEIQNTDVCVRCIGIYRREVNLLKVEMEKNI
jgi:hypothetical protein